MKVLYFEGAGWSGADISKETVGNCRIRTAFHLDDGRAIYLELFGNKRDKKSPSCYKWLYTGFITDCFYITNDDDNDDCNRHSIYRRNVKTIEYSEKGILSFVNSLGASFDAIQVVPDLGGYRVFNDYNGLDGTKRYNYGDEFQFDHVMTARREAVNEAVYEIERKEREEDLKTRAKKFVHSSGEKSYPNFSLWVDADDAGLLHLLRHYNGFNRKWGIRVDSGDTLEDWMKSAVEITDSVTV